MEIHEAIDELTKCYNQLRALYFERAGLLQQERLSKAEAFFNYEGENISTRKETATHFTAQISAQLDNINEDIRYQELRYNYLQFLITTQTYPHINLQQVKDV